MTTPKLRFLTICSFAAAGGVLLSSAASFAQPNPATSYTQEKYEELIKTLPFSNTQSFDDAKEGFIAPLPNEGKVTNAQGRVVYDLNNYAFIMQGSVAPETVNPSLWRQSQLTMLGGLYKVDERIYQVRSADLSNVTFIEGETGIIVIDPLISEETASYALDFYFSHRPKKPVIAVIYTHSHVDHYGGVRGVVDEADVKSGAVKIYAPDGFLDHAVSENVMAGNAMSRRASYMYGNILPANPQGQVGAGLGPTTSSGTITLIPPTNVIKDRRETLEIDGLTFMFQLTPDSEAPSEMFFYIKELNALCTAENATHTLHNTYSLRGARIRNPLDWSKYINEAIYEFGKDVKVQFAPHHWSLKGREKIIEHLEVQRDLYRYINDQPLRLANHGFRMVEIAEMLKMPKKLETTWSARGYYGSVNHDAKSTYVKYLGWFNGNPATLHPYPERIAGAKYVEFMGGADALLQQAQKSYDAGDYRWVAQVVNHLVFAEPDNQDAKNLQADALEQLGYQAESGPWRNFYLSGAKELREGVKPEEAPDTASPDTIRAMDLSLMFDYTALRLNAEKAGESEMVLNWKFPDTNQEYVVELQNGALSHIEGYQSDKADATISINRETINNIILGQETFDGASKSGDLKIEGDQDKLKELLSMLDSFDFWFNIVTPVPLDKANQ
ncbi:MBL fold metallo-hydrolase [Rhodobacteraceae bacterium RKSG542]|uniref:alkyl/aryl-sulfatase n=1 Tax=Pseudovibrio flavus TaxID=2529854 RepID=UPI0012BBA64E|nr:alkyl sulfatase dimerization domain-containing protein [Pseudovibrio flavus]MTI19191.1 MBL fold metallo-hydrolase [Pseudovibrio flavus]